MIDELTSRTVRAQDAADLLVERGEHPFSGLVGTLRSSVQPVAMSSPSACGRAHRRRCRTGGRPGRSRRTRAPSLARGHTQHRPAEDARRNHFRPERPTVPLYAVALAILVAGFGRRRTFGVDIADRTGRARLPADDGSRCVDGTDLAATPGTRTKITDLPPGSLDRLAGHPRLVSPAARKTDPPAASGQCATDQGVPAARPDHPCTAHR